MRIIAALACLFISPAFGTPVTYIFTGTVEFKYDFPLYNDNPNVVGSFTYDPDIGSTNIYGYTPDQLIDYQVSMAGQSFFLSPSFIPHAGWTSTSFSGGRLELFDEIPAVSWTGPVGPDIAQFVLNFAGDPFNDNLPTADLPLDQFIGGSILFGGGSPLPGTDVYVSSSIRASIDHLFRVMPQPVPEPSSIALLACGIAGMLVGRRRRGHDSENFTTR